MALDLEKQVLATNEVFENPTEFDILDVLSGRTLPTDDVVIYTDAQALYTKFQLMKDYQAQASGRNFDKDVIPTYEAEIAKLNERLEKSKVVFTLQAMRAATWDAVISKAEAEEPDDNLHVVDSLLAMSIVQVTSATGQIDKNTWTAGRVEKLRDALAPSEYLRLNESMNALKFASGYFDVNTTVDFLSKR